MSNQYLFEDAKILKIAGKVAGIGGLALAMLFIVYRTTDLKIVAQFAGISGIALIIFFFLFKEVISKVSDLEKGHAYRLLELVLILAWSLAIVGVFAWVYTHQDQKLNQLDIEPKPPEPPILTPVIKQEYPKFQPSIKLNVEREQGKNNVKLTWEVSPQNSNIEKFLIYRLSQGEDSNDHSPIVETISNNWIDTKPLFCKEFYYKIRAISNTTEISATSQPIQIYKIFEPLEIKYCNKIGSNLDIGWKHINKVDKCNFKSYHIERCIDDSYECSKWKPVFSDSCELENAKQDSCVIDMQNNDSFILHRISVVNTDGYNGKPKNLTSENCEN